MNRDEWPLAEVAQLAIYKGTIWATWDAEAPPCLDYLDDARLHLDLTLDGRDGSEGGSEVIAGVHKWIIPCNWKFPAENFLGETDHNISHQSVDLIGIGPSAAQGERGRRDAELAQAEHLWVSFPGGHGVNSAMKPAEAKYQPTFRDDPVVESYYRECYEQRKATLGTEAARLMPSVGTLFPNTSYHSGQPRALCVWHPHGPVTPRCGASSSSMRPHRPRSRTSCVVTTCGTRGQPG